MVNSGATVISKEDIKVKQALIDAGFALPVTIYFHIRRESDRELADKVKKAVESSLSPTNNSIVVPGIQLISGVQSRSVLKCFKQKECKDIGPRLIEIFKDNDVPMELSDQSTIYGQSASVRPNHFEAWFAPGIGK